ncbi:MAG: DUF4907 domain-containing protein [Bacteroidetes bacterium]|nr:DUF4907 domain-containing protein [Bacteroidota bacterium]
MNFRISIYSIRGLFLVACLSSCSNPQEKGNSPTQTLALPAEEIQENTPTPPTIQSQSLELKTFEVIDITSGKSVGWGYDIYVDGKRNIHQPIIPGIAGNNAFSSEEAAKITGTFAIQK